MSESYLTFTKRYILGGSLVLLAILGGASACAIGGNPDALWEIVSQRCVPGQTLRGDPAPCSAVQLEKGFVLMKDRNGPIHDLLMPSRKVTGIEVFANDSPHPPYLGEAWSERGKLVGQDGRPVDDALVSIAVNSRYGRSQNQLHVHIACLRADVAKVLSQVNVPSGPEWVALPVSLVGHSYIARRLPDDWEDAQDPFQLLADLSRSKGEDIGEYGLAIVRLPGSGDVILATRRALTDFNLGSAGELQDYQCRAAASG
jgi:CDP-diacylglycerol pyrophosphatase